MSLTTDAVVIGVGLVGAYLVGKYFVGQLTDMDGALNPTNPNNVVNSTVEDWYKGVTGSTGSIGGDIYDTTHGGALDVTSGNNIINRGVEGLGGWITGQQGWTLGGAVYDWTH